MTAAPEGDGGNNWGGGGATGIAGSGASDASIDVSPDGEASPRRDFSPLCGDGCTPGEGDCPRVTPNGGPVADTCRLEPTESGITGVCAAVGGQGANQPCTTAADCAAGLGCVADEAGSVCREYCCGDVEACPAKTYCDPRPMAESGAVPVLIPVCSLATPCGLLDSEIPCPEGLVCTIVRADGTTSCVTPGSGLLNEPCPCSEGFVCANLTNQCKKLCHLGSDELDCPGGGTCQGGSTAYPPGVGICVGGDEMQY